jgi:NADH-quinone oxidoreductase subunit G
MPKLTINGTEVEVENGTSILQAAEQVGVEVPRFCYHDKLSVPANCRMCLVEVKGGPPKPVASCAMACADGMEVETDSDMVHRARKSVMEFLLINHPLDCPICDQGGECDLQDQAAAYGYDRSRYTEDKRAVKDKELGPLVKTVMTRCIQCTRCIRFGEEIAGIDSLGLLNRGEDVEIGTYVEKAMESELSGNLIDVCPVGALTSKPYAFTARPWELRKTETIDVMDGVGSNIRIDAKGREIMRVVPRLNESVNEVWISDKARFSYDGLKKRRLDRPWVRNTKTKKLEQASWEDAFKTIAAKIEKIKPYDMAALAGDMVDMESVFTLKTFMNKLDCDNLECRVDDAHIDADNPYGYLFNGRIESLDNADAILLVGTNPRVEAAIINARIHNAVRNNKCKVGLIGQSCDLNYAYEHLGTSAKDLESLIAKRSGFAKALKDAKNAVVILGNGAVMRKDGQAIQQLAMKVAQKFDASYNFMHLNGGRVGALSLDFVHSKTQNPLKIDSKQFVYLLGTDTHIVDSIDKKAFVVYQGHHGDMGAHRADVILPGCAYTEKDGLYMNTEGRLQMARKAVSAPGEAQEDWKIIGLLATECAQDLGFKSIFDVRNSMPQLPALDECITAEVQGIETKTKIAAAKFTLPHDNFYQTDPISRASDTMQQCVDAFVSKTKKLEAA